MSFADDFAAVVTQFRIEWQAERAQRVDQIMNLLMGDTSLEVARDVVQLAAEIKAIDARIRKLLSDQDVYRDRQRTPKIRGKRRTASNPTDVVPRPMTKPSTESPSICSSLFGAAPPDVWLGRYDFVPFSEMMICDVMATENNISEWSEL